MLTYDELGITADEYRALLKVRELLAEDKLDIFDMGTSFDIHECGTVACIGGWTYVMMQDDRIDPDAAVNYVSGGRSDPLHPLFYPDDSPITAWWAITPEMAVQAIDNFIETGNPRWEDIPQ